MTVGVRRVRFVVRCRTSTSEERVQTEQTEGNECIHCPLREYEIKSKICRYAGDEERRRKTVEWLL